MARLRQQLPHAAMLTVMLAVLVTAAATRPAGAAALGFGVDSDAAVVSTCSWFAYDASVPSAGYCTVNDDYMLAVPAAPATWIAKQLTRAFGRHHLCGVLVRQTDCEASRHGCFWSERDARCVGVERAQWDWFSRHAYSSEAPAWMLCPGSQAAVAKKCAAAGAGGCAAAKECMLEDGYCCAKFLAAMGEAEKKSWYARLNAGDQGVVGSCGGACYLQGIASCDMWKLPTQNREAACQGSAGACQWDAAGGGVCRPSLMGADAWGTAVVAAMQSCSKLSQDNATCLSASPHVGAVPAARWQRFVDFVQPVGTTAAATGSC
jgi:hypothetical protein